MEREGNQVLIEREGDQILIEREGDQVEYLVLLLLLYTHFLCSCLFPHARQHRSLAPSLVLHPRARRSGCLNHSV